MSVSHIVWNLRSKSLPTKKGCFGEEAERITMISKPGVRTDFEKKFIDLTLETGNFFRAMFGIYFVNIIVCFACGNVGCTFGHQNLRKRFWHVVETAGDISTGVNNNSDAADVDGFICSQYLDPSFGHTVLPKTRDS